MSWRAYMEKMRARREAARKARAPPAPAPVTPTVKAPEAIPAGVKEFRHMISYHSRTGEVASEGTIVYMTDGSTYSLEVYKRDMYDVGVAGMEYMMRTYGYGMEQAKKSAMMGQFVDYPPPAWAYWGPPRSKYLKDLLAGPASNVPPDKLELGHD